MRKYVDVLAVLYNRKKQTDKMKSIDAVSLIKKRTKRMCFVIVLINLKLNIKGFVLECKFVFK